jgi:hypothetical protein
LSRGSSGKASVVYLSLSSNEEGLIVDTSHNEEFARRLFGNLNHDVLGPPGDGKIIILNDSDEEEDEMREKKTAGDEAAPSSTARSPTSTASASVDDAPTGVTNDNSDDHTPNREVDGSSDSGDEAGLP